MSVKQNINGTLVNIAGAGAASAANVSYDNTESGLTATNVQNAIDEISTSLTELATVLYDNCPNGQVTHDTTICTINLPKGKWLIEFNFSNIVYSDITGTMTGYGQNVLDVTLNSATTLTVKNLQGQTINVNGYVKATKLLN